MSRAVGATEEVLYEAPYDSKGADRLFTRSAHHEGVEEKPQTARVTSGCW